MCFSVQVDIDLKRLAYRFDAVINQKAFDNYKQLENEDSNKYKYVYPEDQRVFSKVWTPIICEVRGVREIRPMRYQLLPHFCTEEKYTRIDEKTGKSMEIKNTFNARLDSLTSAQAWKKPFMQLHAMLPIKKFYEWVPKDGHKAMISFYPDSEESFDDYILTPCLYDNWFSPDKSKIIQSFAIITDEPRDEVRAMGHDRTPINLDEKHLSSWLNPAQTNQAEILNILQNPVHPKYGHKWLT